MTGAVSGLGPAGLRRLEYWSGAGLKLFPVHEPVGGEVSCSCGRGSCSHAGKHPRTRNGHKAATSDLNTITEWLQRWPQSNWGIATGAASGVLVLDIDPRNGGDESLRQLVAQYGELPETPEIATGGGGRHFYFRHPGPLVRSRANLCPGIDIKADGGYVVAPGSLHASGQRYSEVVALGEIDFAAVPSWLTSLIEGGNDPLRHQAHGTPAAASCDGVPEGGRNNFLASQAGAMRRRGMSEDAIASALLVENNDRCKPPLPDHEVRAIAASISRYEPAASQDPSGSRQGSPSNAAKLVDIAHRLYRPGMASDCSGPFLAPLDGSCIVQSLRGNERELKARLSKAFNEQEGRPPTSSSKSDALAVLEGEALDQDPEDVWLRVAQKGGSLIIDLGQPDCRVAVVNSAEWRVVREDRCLFRRTALTAPMPTPTTDEGLEAYFAALALSPADTQLLIAWAVATLIPSAPQPIALFRGPQGAGKSTAARALVRLLDPSTAELRSVPRKPDDWPVAASASLVIALDNLSRISAELSDALCKSVTGDAVVRRALYTDSDLSVVSFRRAIILTGIEIGCLRGDLADRMVFFSMEALGSSRRRAEAELEDELRSLLPGALGGLLTLTSRVLGRLDSVELAEPSRMADFERILVAIDQTTGWRTAVTYRDQRRSLAAEVAADDPVAGLLLAFLDQQPHWTGTMTELLEELERLDPGGSPPRSANALSNKLTRIEASLLELGLAMRRHRAPQGKARLVTFETLPGSRSRPVDDVDDAATGSERGA